jgi:hypothetical protein
MGRSYTPKYRLEMDGATMCGWQVGSHYGIPGNGAPNDANLARYVEAYVASQDPGSVPRRSWQRSKNARPSRSSNAQMRCSTGLPIGNFEESGDQEEALHGE